MRPLFKMAGDVDLHVGSKFQSLKAVEEAMKRLEQQQLITYWIRDSRKVAAYEKRAPDGVVINPALVYVEMRWTCIKGGRKFHSNGKGDRPNARSVH